MLLCGQYHSSLKNPPEEPPFLLPEFTDFILFGNTMLVANNKLGLVWAIPPPYATYFCMLFFFFFPEFSAFRTTWLAFDICVVALDLSAGMTAGGESANSGADFLQPLRSARYLRILRRDAYAGTSRKSPEQAVGAFVWLSNLLSPPRAFN